MANKERAVKKVFITHEKGGKSYNVKPDEEGGCCCNDAAFSRELCDDFERIRYCVPFNCVNCEYRTECTYVYELF
ncbi:MAG: hypothetical protein IJZ94_00205 [Clostridia bacterium]|nr:hypothetical protein [Clostridia bacterium]